MVRGWWAHRCVLGGDGAPTSPGGSNHLWVPRPPSRHTVAPISPRANQPSSRPSSRPAHQPIYQPNNHPTSQPTILPPSKPAYNFSCSGVSKGDGGLSGPRACGSTFVSGTQKWAYKPSGQRVHRPLLTPRPRARGWCSHWRHPEPAGQRSCGAAHIPKRNSFARGPGRGSQERGAGEFWRRGRLNPRPDPRPDPPSQADRRTPSPPRQADGRARATKC